MLDSWSTCFVGNKKIAETCRNHPRKNLCIKIVLTESALM